MDLSETLKACQRLHGSIPQVLDREIDFIRNNEVEIIVGDIPPLCFEIARRAEIPSIAITNFTWNFIYRAYLRQYPGFLPLIVDMERFYSQATLALALPYSCQMEVFPRREAIPWITRVSPLAKDEARKKFALPRSAVIVLLSFGGLGLNRFAWEKLEKLPEYYFIAAGETTTRRGNGCIFSDPRTSYADLVRASDVIVSKPGYGIVADAIVHQTRMLYTGRGEFAEDQMLVKALQECATAEFIPQADLLAAKLGPYLSLVLNRPPKAPSVVIKGAAVAAKKVLSLLETRISPAM